MRYSITQLLPLEMSEEVRDMSEEEMDRQIAILEAEGRKEKEKIEARQKEKALLAI